MVRKDTLRVADKDLHCFPIHRTQFHRYNTLSFSYALFCLCSYPSANQYFVRIARQQSSEFHIVCRTSMFARQQELTKAAVDHRANHLIQSPFAFALRYTIPQILIPISWIRKENAAAGRSLGVRLVRPAPWRLNKNLWILISISS